MDEATSALDNTSEKQIQAEIEKMKEACGTTVISVAHRLTTLQNCDEILVMDKGRIVQRGTFQELQEIPASSATWPKVWQNRLRQHDFYSSAIKLRPGKP